MKADWKRVLLHMAVMLAGSALSGTLLLTLAFCIPTGRIREHVAESADRVLDGGQPGDHAFWRHIKQHKESYTDSIIAQYAFEKIEGKNAYEHAMWAWHYDLEEEIWAAEDSLRAVLAGTDPSEMHLREYSRYWHGYLLYVKPLLLLVSWEQLVWLELALEAFLLAAAVVLSFRKKCPGVAAALAAGLLFMKPELMMASLTMSVCLLILLAAVLVLLLKGGWLREKGYFPEFFLCIGILTAYFDFLTYPVATLGVPLCVYFLLSQRERISAALGRIVGYGFCWGVGYAGMWASKWVIADVTLGTGTIKDALWNVLGRTEAIGGRPRLNGGQYVISLNLQEYDSRLYGIAAGALALFALVALVWALGRKTPMKVLWEAAFPFLAIAAIPFAWIVIVQHHSALHARFTFRILGVAAMALCGMGIRIGRTCIRERKSAVDPGE
ncbi:MAG: hypothetical protein NC399_06670 [Muribaculum sp.]|nr:hypothetical protein [Muribaculum sp.]